MIKKIIVFIFTLSLIILTSCSRNTGIMPSGTEEMIRENWVSQINTDPSVWLRGADNWFLTGEPNITQIEAKKSLLLQPLSLTKVRVPNFVDITVAGEFQVQLVGGEACNSVYVYGPNELARQISVNVTHNKLTLTQPDKPIGNLQNVIVRIGLKNLRSLEVYGTSLIMGRNITSNKMRILSNSAGTILLQGKMNLKILEHNGIGSITAIGVRSPSLNVAVGGNGNVNLSGRIRIHTLSHRGNGTVNILGADSNAVCIDTAGSGLTTIHGCVNVKRITADQNSRVYVYWNKSPQLDVISRENAIVGIAGNVGSLNVSSEGKSCFLGQYLRSENTYVKTKNTAHADVTARHNIFASASHQSVILYYGSPRILSRYISEQGAVFVL